MAVVQNKRYLVVFNPVQNSKRQKLLAQLITTLKSRQLDYRLYPTEANLTANSHYFKSHLHEFTDVVVLGGDGTFHVIVNCIVNAKLNDQIKVGLLPSGTGNDFARQWFKSSLGANYSTKQLIDIALGDNTQTLHLGECHYEQKIRYFTNVLGIGFDAVIAKQLANQKTLFRSLSYILAAIRYIPFYKEPHCELEFKGNKSQYRNLITAFANSQYFGGGLPIAPGQDGRKSSLMIVRAPKFKVLSKMMLLLKLTKGTHLASEGVFHDSLGSSDVAGITTVGLAIEAEGEYLGETPCQVKVSSHTINLKV